MFGDNPRWSSLASLSKPTTLLYPPSSCFHPPPDRALNGPVVTSLSFQITEISAALHSLVANLPSGPLQRTQGGVACSQPQGHFHRIADDCLNTGKVQSAAYTRGTHAHRCMASRATRRTRAANDVDCVAVFVKVFRSLYP